MPKNVTYSPLTLCLCLCRRIENEVIQAAATVGKVRTSMLVAEIREKILRSQYPRGVVYMRKIDALRQVKAQFGSFSFITTLSLNTLFDFVTL
jgi:hypothetical protein